jgi:AAA lid domain
MHHCFHCLFVHTNWLCYYHTTTINILIITDSALVLAAQLADRYITGRYNPDKAIDLLDEAAAVISSQVIPPVIDALNRRLLQLEIEATGKCQHYSAPVCIAIFSLDCILLVYFSNHKLVLTVDFAMVACMTYP